MKGKPEIVEWFSGEPLPDVFQYPAIVLGGRGLLRDFMGLVARSRRGGKLHVATPFVTRAAFSVTGTWDVLRHDHTELKAVTQSRHAAMTIQERLAVYDWSAFEIRVCNRLHAKVYAYVATSGESACLVGSHNLSVAAAARNEEAGVLFVSTGKDSLGYLAPAWQRHIDELCLSGDDVTDRLSPVQQFSR